MARPMDARGPHLPARLGPRLIPRSFKKVEGLNNPIPPLSGFDSQLGRFGAAPAYLMSTGAPENLVAK